VEERDFIKEALNRHKKERKNIAIAWVHARLGICLAPLRRYLSGLIAPAFLAYQWGDVVHSIDSNGEIRSKDTWVPLRDDVLRFYKDTINSSSLNSKIMPQQIETHTIKDLYKLRRTYVAYIGGEEKNAVVIFTGTDHWKVWGTDLWAFTVEVTYFEGTQLEVKVKVHSGIYSMFTKIWDKIITKTTKDPDGKDIPILLQAKTITVGGHSLGAALSHIFALKLIEYRYLKKEELQKDANLTLIVTTFACPAVFLFDEFHYREKMFLTSFTRAYSGISKGSFKDIITNFNNHNDIVVYLPRYRILGFKSIGSDVLFTKDYNGDKTKEHSTAYLWLKHIDFGEAKEYFRVKEANRFFN
jgi:Lipase (class 3)